MIANPLSDREFEIVRLVALGMSSEQIAEKLFVSPHTVSTHRRNILEKTEKQSMGDVILKFKERGLL